MIMLTTLLFSDILKHTRQMTAGRINFISLKLLQWGVCMIRRKELTLQLMSCLFTVLVVKACFYINLSPQPLDYFAVSYLPLHIAMHTGEGENASTAWSGACILYPFICHAGYHLPPAFQREGNFTRIALPVVPFPLSVCHP